MLRANDGLPDNVFGIEASGEVKVKVKVKEYWTVGVLVMRWNMLLPISSMSSDVSPSLENSVR